MINYYLQSTTVCSGLRCWCQLRIKGKTGTLFFLNLMVNIWLKHFVHSTYDLCKVKLLLLQLVVKSSTSWHYMCYKDLTIQCHKPEVFITNRNNNNFTNFNVSPCIFQFNNWWIPIRALLHIQHGISLECWF